MPPEGGNRKGSSMFAEPQALTLDGAALSLARTGQGLNSGVFQTTDGFVKMSISHSYGKRTRRTIRIDHQKTATDPLIPAQNKTFSMSYYIVADVPPVGYTPADQVKILKGLFANLAATTDANWNRFVGGES